MQQIYSIYSINKFTPMLKCEINKVALQLYWNYNLALVLSCKFAVYFQNIFLQEHLWRTTSDYSRSIFRILSHIYDEAYWRKQLTAFSSVLSSFLCFQNKKLYTLFVKCSVFVKIISFKNLLQTSLKSLFKNIAI